MPVFDAACAGQQIGVVQLAAGQRVRQRRDHVFLAGQFRKSLRAPLAGENLIAHARIIAGFGIRRKRMGGEP